MACSHREKTGYCSHHQCPFPDQSGYECVEVEHRQNLCECGQNCVPECPYSYKPGDVKDCPDPNHKQMTEEIYPYLCDTCGVFGIVRIENVK